LQLPPNIAILRNKHGIMKKKFSLLQSIRSTITAQGLFTKNDRVLVALSGGPDSVALLTLLNELQKEFNISLFIAHLNHKLRGKSSDEDEQFVRNIAKKLAIPVYTDSKNITSLSKKTKKSIEETARNERYAFFERAAKHHKCTIIALAHTADDNVETVLFNFMRGTTHGLSGIPAKRKSASCTIIRPLLNLWKKDLLCLLEEEHISYRTDDSNFDTTFTRNKIRHTLIPLLEKDFNPNIKETIHANIENSTAIKNFITTQAQTEFKTIATIHSPEKLTIDIKRFLTVHLALQKEILRKSIFTVKRNLTGIHASHINQIIGLITNTQSGKKLLIPGSIFIQKEFDSVVLQKRVHPQQKNTSSHATITIPGISHCKKLSISCETKLYDRKKDANETALKKERSETQFSPVSHTFTEYLDADTLPLPLSIRTRKEGDTFTPIGSSHAKKVKDIFINEKVPLSLRDHIPLLVDSQNTIVWIIGYRIGNKHKITTHTKKILKITVESL